MGIGLLLRAFSAKSTRGSPRTTHQHDELARFRLQSWTRASERRQRYRAALAGASAEPYDQAYWSSSFVGWALRSRALPCDPAARSNAHAPCPRAFFATRDRYKVRDAASFRPGAPP